MTNNKDSFLKCAGITMVVAILSSSLLLTHGEKIQSARDYFREQAYAKEKAANDSSCNTLVQAELKLPGVWDPGQECCAIPQVTRVVNAEGPTYGTCLNLWPPPSV